MMIKRVALILAAFSLISASPSHAFLDYLFSGSASRDAIDNSAVGDIRAWWSGNPVYQFNPYYSGPASMQQQQQAQQPQQQQMMQQPSVNFYPGGQADGGYPQPQQQAGTYGYQGYSPGGAYQQQSQQQMYGAAQPQVQQPPQYYPPQPQAQPVYQTPQQYAPMGQAPQGYPGQPGAYQ